MSAIKLDLVHAFGSTCSQMHRNAITICDEDKGEPKLVFPVGKTLALKHIDRQEMDFVHFSQNIEYMSCVSLLPTRTHVAIAEKPINSPLEVIRIYNILKEEPPHTIRIFHETDKVGKIKLIVFSASEPKFMCSLVGQPHNKLIFVETERNKPLAESSFTLKEIQKISISPFNSHLICATGGNMLKLFKVEEYAFKPLEQIKKIPKNRVITDHCWFLKKMLIIATDKCEIFILEEAKPNQYEVRQEYSNVFNELKFDDMYITSICSFSKGFILGSNNGRFCLWMNKQDLMGTNNIKLEIARKWSTTQERAAEVTCIVASLKQDLIAVSLANNDVAMFSLTEMLPNVTDFTIDSTEKEVLFEYLYKGFHNNAITGLDSCQQRPLIASCSQEDSTIRIWNYKNYGCKLLRMFYFKIKEQNESDKPLLTLAFHPSGYYLAVGCIDKLRFFHVLNNELRPFRQIGIKMAKIVKFSNGGHLIAVCFPLKEDSNADQLRVYNALTLQEIITFKDHNSAIKHIEWKTHDEALCSVSSQGLLIEWRVNDWSKARQVNNKSIQYETFTYSHGRNCIITFGTMANIPVIEEFMCDSAQEFPNNRLELDMKVVKMLELKTHVGSAMMLALQNGSLVIFGGIHQPQVLQYRNEHVGRINQMTISPCGKYVMTAGEDCLILLYKLYAEVEGIAMEEENANATVDDYLADVVLINKKDIHKYKQKEKEYCRAIKVLDNKLKLVAVERQKKHQQQMAQLVIQKNRIIDSIAFRIERLAKQVQELQRKNNEAIDDLDGRNTDDALTLEKLYEEKIEFEQEKYFQLEQHIIQARFMHKEVIEKLEQQGKMNIELLKLEFNNKFKESEEIYSNSKESVEEATKIFSQKLNQIQQEQEEELREIEIKKQKFETETQELLKDLQQKLHKLKKEHENLSEERRKLKEENEELIFEKKKLEKEFEETKIKYCDMDKDYEDKIDSLKSKEEKIIEFQRKVNDLQKKKHILSYKATQMRKAIEPKDVQIEKLKLDLIRLKEEFEKSIKRKQVVILAVERVQKDKQHLQKSLRDEATETNKQTNLLDQILSDVYDCLEGIETQGESKGYYKEILKLYHKYVDGSQKADKNTSGKNVDEMGKQIVYLEKSLYQINRANEKNVLRKNDEIDKKTKENTELVNDLNDIKKENRQLNMKIRSKKEEIEKMRSIKMDILSQCKSIDPLAYKKFTRNDEIDENKKSLKKSLVSSTLGGQQSILVEPKLNYQKQECELMSDIEFINEKQFKYEFYLKDMKEKIRKHFTHFKCQGKSIDVEGTIDI